MRLCSWPQAYCSGDNAKADAYDGCDFNLHFSILQSDGNSTFKRIALLLRRSIKHAQMNKAGDSNEREPLLSDRLSQSPVGSRSGKQKSQNAAFRSPSPSPERPEERSHSISIIASSSASSASNSAKNGSHSPLLILPLNFFNAFGWSLIEVPLIYLLRTRICELKFGDKPGSLPYELDKCRSEDIQVYVSGIRAAFQTIAAVLGLLTTCSYGSMSDTQGRRKVLLICSAFQLIGDIGILAIVMLPGYTTPYYILMPAIFKGLGGYISAIVAGQNSYVADCTSSDNRSRYLGWNFATYHLGTAAGPLISGVLVAEYDRMDLVYAISVSLWGLYFLYTLFILPESNPPGNFDTEERGDEHSISSTLSTVDAAKFRMHAIGHFLMDNFVSPLAIVLPSRTKTSLDVLGTSTEAKRHWDVCIAAVLIGLTLFSTGSMGMLPLYTDYKLNWGPLKASLLMSVDAGASAITLTFVFPFTCWIFGKFLRNFRGFSGLDDLSMTIPWLSSQDSEQPPSNFYPGPRSSLPRPKVQRSSSRRMSPEQEDFSGSREDDDVNVSRQPEDVSKKITVVKRDIWVARTGYLAAALASGGVALARSDTQLYLAIVVQSLSNIALPAIQSVALNGVRAEYNGRILAGFAIIESLALIFRGPLYAGIYNFSLPEAPAAIYWVSAGVYLSCIFILSFAKLYRPLGSSQ